MQGNISVMFEDCRLYDFELSMPQSLLLYILYYKNSNGQRQQLHIIFKLHKISGWGSFTWWLSCALLFIWET